MPASGRILFVPRAVEGGASPSRPLRPGLATFAADGAFRATSWTPGDGLVPGTYAVVVECWKVPPTMDGPPAESHLAAAVGSAATTPLEVVVTAAGGAVSATFDVPPP